MGAMDFVGYSAGANITSIVAGYFGFLDFVGYRVGANPNSALPDSLDRFLPINYLPRWMNPYYDLEDPFRIFYAGNLYFRSKMMEAIDLEFKPEFWKPTWQTRQVYVAKYTYPKNYNPRVRIVSAEPNLVTNVVSQVQTVQSLRFTNHYPVVCFNEGIVLLKNITMVEFEVTVPVQAATTINLATQFTAHPPTTDTAIAIGNAYDEWVYLDQQDVRIVDGLITVSLPGTYKLRYQSQSLHESFLDGSSYITIDGEQIRISPYQLQNIWDEYAWLINLRRLEAETNVSLKTKCQHMTLVEQPQSLISAALGKTQFITWATRSALNLSGSGFISLEVNNTGPSEYIEEQPVKDGAGFLLRYVPTDVIQLYLDTVALPTSTFMVTGSTIVPLTVRLANAKSENLVARYKTNWYTTSSSNNNLTGLTRANDGRELKWVVATKGVRMATESKRVREWRWDRNIDMRKGQARFI